MVKWESKGTLSPFPRLPIYPFRPFNYFLRAFRFNTEREQGEHDERGTRCARRLYRARRFDGRRRRSKDRRRLRRAYLRAHQERATAITLKQSLRERRDN